MKEVSRDELLELTRNEGVTVVDALPEAPYRRRHLPGALNLTHEDAEAQAAVVLPDRTATIVTYSTDRNCDRGEALAGRLAELGYTDIRLYRDGIEDWVGSGLPVEAAT